MFEFPNLVYISPGVHQCNGGTFNYLQVVDGDALVEAAKKGYYPTIELAMEKPDNFNWGDYVDAKSCDENNLVEEKEKKPKKAKKTELSES